MNITKISIDKYLGINFYKSDNLGKVNLVSGGNGAGKSSLLKAIRETFKSSGVDESLITVGADKAEIRLTMDNGLELYRKITPKTNELKATLNGSPVETPTKYLRALLGDNVFNFEPVKFFQADSAERRALILKAIPFKLTKLELQMLIGMSLPALGLDLDKHNYDVHGLDLLARVAQDVFDARHEVNYNLTMTKKAIEKEKLDMEALGDLSAWDNFDLNKEISQLSSLRSLKENHESRKKSLVDLRASAAKSMERVDALVEEVEDYKKKIAEAQEKIDHEREYLETVVLEGKRLAGEVGSFAELQPSIDEIQARIDGYQEFQKTVHRLENIKEREKEAITIKERWDFLDAEYKRFMEEIPSTILGQLKVDKIYKDLKITADDITVGGVQLDKLSSSEQVKFSVRMAKALCGALKVVIIDGLEELDASSRKAFYEEASVDEFEYIMAMVTDGPLTVESTGGKNEASVPEEKGPTPTKAETKKSNKKSPNPGF